MFQQPITLTLVAAAVVGLLLLSGTANSQAFVLGCPSPALPTPPPANALGIDASCPIQGTGPKEAAQNTAKNNFCAGGPAQPITIDDMKTLQQNVQTNSKINFGNPRDHPLSRTPGPTKDRTPLRTLGEGTLRSLQGFVFAVRQEKKETVNCGTNVPNNDLFHDIHISIVADEASTHGDECTTVVVEMSPHHRPDSWTAANLQRVATKHKLVRVTGQLFFDSSHTPCQDDKEIPGDPRRVSLWELHPIYKFDVCNAASCTTETEWIPLDQWLTQNP
ncbi:MAG: hypothetical protein LAO31_16445 [Acidobacteriia bacterium]|nr:hypothetical protein [Terriglobia bacterium]